MPLLLGQYRCDGIVNPLPYNVFLAKCPAFRNIEWFPIERYFMVHHNHTHAPQDKRILSLSLTIITVFMVVEFIGGYHFNSLALMADAGHMANDSFSLFLAWIALFLSKHKQKWLALFNGISLIIVALWILCEAVKRWQQTTEIVALPMLGVATLGLLVNLFVIWLLRKSDQTNLNIKAAYLHVLADLFGSALAIISGLSAWLLNWQWVDIVASTLLAILVLRSGIGIVQQAIAHKDF